MLILENRFGLSRCLGGTHPSIREGIERMVTAAAMIHHVSTCTIEDFLQLENMGVESPLRRNESLP